MYLITYLRYLIDIPWIVYSRLSGLLIMKTLLNLSLLSAHEKKEADQDCFLTAHKARLFVYNRAKQQSQEATETTTDGADPAPRRC